MRKLERVAIATACCAAIAPSSALAQQEGVDPDSPAGIEYVLPVEGARRDAAPATGNGDRRISLGDRSAPPFGVGITPPLGGVATSGSGSGDSQNGGGGGGGGGGGEGGTGPSDSSADRSRPGAASDRSLPPATQGPASPSTVLATADGGFDELALALGIAGGVVATGVLLGLIARRRRAS